jgi:putative endonuclease
MTASHHNQRVGRVGEDLAVQLLTEKGYLIIERNIRVMRGELDIVARDGKTLVFVEVKTGTTTKFGDPAAWVNLRKQKQVGKTALAYLTQNGLESESCRFDVVAVSRKDGKMSARHIEDAFWLDPNLMEESF